MSRKQKRNKGATASRYLIPAWLTDRKTYNLAVMDVSTLSDLQRKTEEAIETNRKRYERDASAYTRLVMEARTVYGNDHEIVRLLSKHPVEPPPLLKKMFDEIKVLWAKERQGNINRFQQRAIDQVKTAIRREVKRRKLEGAASPTAPPEPAPILGLPSNVRSTIRQRALREARALAGLFEARGVVRELSSSSTICMPPPPGSPTAEILTGQLNLFGAKTDLTGLYG
jgi:hypothetical protein